VVSEEGDQTLAPKLRGMPSERVRVLNRDSAWPKPIAISTHPCSAFGCCIAQPLAGLKPALWPELALALELIEELARPHIQAPRDAQNRRQPWLTCPSLKPPHCCRVNVGLSSELVLADAALGPQLSQPFAKCLACALRIVL